MIYKIFTIILPSIFLLGALSEYAFPQAKYEPPQGCYIGAFIVNDPVVQGSITQFETLAGKKHSSYFSYAAYGQPFPSVWVEDYASKGNIVQIAFEPNNGLNEVVDGPYIRDWAKAARRSGAMIFLRWACEMNGSWVAWYGNPDLYKEKFRLIFQIMKEEAPNVAMVWAPNDGPNDPLNPPNYIHSYYPGDAYVDWVGVDFYGVYFYENGAPERRLPSEKLKVVYDVYSARKPIIICEWAAAHYTTRVSPAVSCSTYCISQMDSLYRIAKDRFPRLKSINWFSMNSLTQNNCNFSLTENPAVLNNYKDVINVSHFLSTPFRNVPSIKTNLPQGDTVIRNTTQLQITAESSVPLDSMVLRLGELRIAVLTSPPYSFEINPALYSDGIYELKSTAFASSGFNNYEVNRIIIDNKNQYVSTVVDDIPGGDFTLQGAWNISTSQPDRYGPYYHFSIAGDGSNKAFWKFNLQTAGSYNVYAFWSAHPNRATNAPFIVPVPGGKDTIRVNQEQNGGKWNLLGRYNFAPGEVLIELNNQANEIVIADAVRVEWAFNLPVKVKEADQRTIEASDAVIFPNPVSRESEIVLSGFSREGIKLYLYDLRGSLLGIREITGVNASSNVKLFDGTFRENYDKMSSGFYVLRIISNEAKYAVKFLMLK